MEKARGFFKKIISIIKKPEMRILPGQLAFFLIMSLIPLTALLGAIAAKFSISIDTLESSLKGVLPNGVITIVVDIMTNRGINFNIAVFLISTFILASNGPHSMIITSNEIYKIKSNNAIRRRIKAIMMTFILVGLFFILFLIPISGDYIIKVLTNSNLNEQTIKFITIQYQLIKYPILIIFLYVNIKLLYLIAPDEDITSVSATEGAVFTTIGWIIATEIYSFYIGAFTSYDVFYGSISNIVILLIWVYILSYIFVLGMIINYGTFKEEQTKKLKVVKED